MLNYIYGKPLYMTMHEYLMLWYSNIPKPLPPQSDIFITVGSPPNDLTYYARFDERLGRDVPMGMPIDGTNP